MSVVLRLLSSALCAAAVVLLAIGIALVGQTAFADPTLPGTDCDGCTTSCPMENNVCKTNPPKCTTGTPCKGCSCQTPPRGGCKCCKDGSSCSTT